MSSRLHKKLNILIEFSTSVFIKFYFIAKWHWTCTQDKVSSTLSYFTPWTLTRAAPRNCCGAYRTSRTPPIVGKGGHTPSFSKIPPFLEIQDVPTFHRSIGKTKELNNSFNQFVYNFYPQSILNLEECLQNWWDANLI